MGYDDEYGAAPALFGEHPERTVTRFCDQLEPSRPVLDIGGGQGRNALYLTRRGLAVELLEPSRVALASVASTAARAGVDLRLIEGTFQSFDADEATYGGVLVFGLIQILTLEQSEALIRRLRRWTAPDGLVFVTAFTTDDQGYVARRDDPGWVETGPRSFRDESGEIMTFLAPGQVVELFDGWDIVHHWEGTGPEHRHGQGPLERHGLVEAVVRRRGY